MENEYYLAYHFCYHVSKWVWILDFSRTVPMFNNLFMKLDIAVMHCISRWSCFINILIVNNGEVHLVWHNAPEITSNVESGEFLRFLLCKSSCNKFNHHLVQGSLVSLIHTPLTQRISVMPLTIESYENVVLYQVNSSAFEHFDSMTY